MIKNGHRNKYQYRPRNGRTFPPENDPCERRSPKKNRGHEFQHRQDQTNCSEKELFIYERLSYGEKQRDR